MEKRLRKLKHVVGRLNPTKYGFVYLMASYCYAYRPDIYRHVAVLKMASYSDADPNVSGY